MYSLGTKDFRYSVSDEGHNLEFTDLRTGKNYAKNTYCAILTDNERKEHYPVSAEKSNDRIKIVFDNETVLKVIVKEHEEYITFTLDYVSNEDFFSVAFCNVEMDISYDGHLYKNSDLFTASLMGMTVSTRMKEHPGRNTVLRAEAYPRIGLFSTLKSKYPAKAAIMAGADCTIRDIMKKVLDEIPDGELPKSDKGGPYAYDCADARRTYTTLSGIRLEEVDNIVERLSMFGITQVGIHQGHPYRQGDFVVNRDLYPNGISDFKKVIDRFHSHGIQVGLHPYTFFVSHESSYLTPVPHEELDSICELTLAKDIDENDTEIQFLESPDRVAEIYDYSLVSSPYVKIGKELIRFNKLRKEPPYAFIDCERGALKTTASEHHAGEQMKQLKERFCYVAPKANSNLFYEIAKNTAEFYNECNFDMMYLDAIDGVYCLDGNDYAWYHATAFIAEMFRHLKSTPIFDCCYNPQYTGSWYARSRYGALDAGNRGYVSYIDAHVNYNNRTAELMYIPQELGWWDLWDNSSKYGKQAKVISLEDVEYLCAKIVGTDCCMSYRSGSVLTDNNHLNRCSDIIKQYDTVRKSATPEIRRMLREQGKRFTLSLNENTGEYLFLDAAVKRHRVDSFENNQNTIYNKNPFDSQKPFLSIEPLCAAADYDSPEGVVLKHFDEEKPIPNDAAYVLDKGSYDNPDGNTGLGIWMYGDGSGTIVRIRLANELDKKPRNRADYFIKADYIGWRYFGFTESQNEELDNSEWPRTEMIYRVYTDVSVFYDAYKRPVDFTSIGFLSVTTDSKTQTNIRLKPIKLLPSYENTLLNPRITINGHDVVFNTALKSFNTLEYTPEGDCTVYDYFGNIVEKPTVTGEIGLLTKQKNNAVTLSSDDKPPHQKRAAVTIKLIGSPSAPIL
ncbi:MAG: hypothetical protein GX633_00170 [Clostridiales bacterium]|nr:hypothetical protein [Clostridiales bacterium]